MQVGVSPTNKENEKIEGRWKRKAEKEKEEEEKEEEVEDNNFPRRGGRQRRVKMNTDALGRERRRRKNNMTPVQEAE